MSTSTPLRIERLRAAQRASMALLRPARRLLDLRVVAFAARAGVPDMRVIDSVYDRAAVQRRGSE